MQFRFLLTKEELAKIDGIASELLSTLDGATRSSSSSSTGAGGAKGTSSKGKPKNVVAAMESATPMCS